jgi:hypothetical protein
MASAATASRPPRAPPSAIPLLPAWHCRCQTAVHQVCSSHVRKKEKLPRGFKFSYSVEEGTKKGERNSRAAVGLSEGSYAGSGKRAAAAMVAKEVQHPANILNSSFLLFWDTAVAVSVVIFLFL